MFGDIPATIDFSQSTSTLINVRIQPSTIITQDTPVYVSIISNTFTLVKSSNPVWTYLVQGVVTDIQPPTGQEGTKVTITGTNLLGGGNTVIQVLVDGVQGRIESVSDAKIVIVMSKDSARKTAFPGQAYILADTGAVVTGGSYTHQSSRTIASFQTTGLRQIRQTSGGVISDVIPPDGLEGTIVIIRGTALFPNDTQLYRVMVGGNPVSRTITATSSEITIIVGKAPSNNPTMAEIVITANDGSFVNGGFFNFTSLVISLPGQTSGTEGTVLDIALPISPLFDTMVGLTATVDDEVAEIQNKSSSLITVRVPRAKRLGTFTADVAIVNPLGLVARLPNGFTYLPEGDIHAVSPNFGQRGTRVVLEGENLLGGGAAISFAVLSEVRTRVLLSDNQRVEVELLENPPVSIIYPLLGNIFLTADTGAITVRLNGFTLIQPGAIQMISPVSGQVGTRVTITGTGLLQGGGEEIQQVTLAGIQVAVILNASDTRIIVEASSSSNPLSGLVEIQLTTGAVITSEQSFVYLQEGVTNRLTPNHGTEGTRVLIEGSNLLGGGSSVQRVLLNGVEAIVESSTDSSIAVIAQAGEPGFGGVEIVSDTGARVVRAFSWTYTELGGITSIEPPIGQQGIDVTLEGMRLLGSSGTSVTECRLAGILGTVVTPENSRSRVICRAGFFPNLISQPANGTGPAEVVTNTGVVIRSEPNITFTYYVAQIDTVTPSTGNNGTIVEINLTGFPAEGSEIVSVDFDGVEATILSSTNNSVTVRAGLSTSATQDSTVRVTSTDGSFLELTNDAWSFSALKQIVSISPEMAFPGGNVTITGLNLNTPAGVNVAVIVGQTQSPLAKVISDTAIEFVAGVHQSTDNAREPLPVQIVYSTGETVFEPSVTFTYNETLGIIDSVSPNAGAENTMVRITGRNLLGDQTVSQVYLAGVAVTSIQGTATNEEIVVLAGAGPDEGGFGTVVIERSSGIQFGLSGNAWRYYPRLNSTVVSPLSGQNGTIVTINFSSVIPLPTILNITLVGTPALDFSVAPNRVITATVETTDSTMTSVRGDVVIFFANSTQLTIMDAWTYLESVRITSFSNMQGYFNSLVILNGQNFQAGGRVNVNSVYLAGLESQIVSQSDLQLQVRITEFRNSSSQSFQGPVVIVSDQQATYTSSENFTYVQVSVDSVNPQQGQRGTRVTITGVGLLLGGSSLDAILLRNVSATVNNATNTEIIVSAGEFPNETDFSNIVYRANNEAELTIPDSWRYIVPGEITSVSPREIGPGTIVTIRGTNLFGGGTKAETVLLNNIPAQRIINNFDNFIQVAAGQSSIADRRARANPMPVTLISSTGSTTTTNSNETIVYIQGSITTVEPREGHNGTNVTIEGSSLHLGKGIREIRIAGVIATIVLERNDDMVGSTNNYFVVRAGSPPTPHSFSGPVITISHDDTTFESSFNFTYLSVGQINSVTPDQGQAGTIVVIEGRNLLGGGADLETASLAGTPADIIGTPTNSVVILRANPMQEAVVGDIVLISDTGAYVQSLNRWRYVENGSVLDIQPRQGRWGTRVVITGVELLSGGDSVVRGSLDNVIDLEIIRSNATQIEAQLVAPPSSPDLSSFNVTNITLFSNCGRKLAQDIKWLFLESTIETISPSSGFRGTIVTITGNNLLGGGSEIESAILDMTPAEVISSNDILVALIAGYSLIKQNRAGDVQLVSDTGAITVKKEGWTYESECPLGQYENDGNCQPCDSECLNGCSGPSPYECVRCRGAYFVLSNGNNNYTLCVSTCNADSSKKAFYNDSSGECQPCSSLCSFTEGCTGPSPYECVRCEGPSFVFPNGTLCVSTCNPDSSRKTFYSDSSGVCQPCSSLCSLTEGCTGPSPYECVRCVGHSFVFPNETLCVPTCNPDSSQKTFYADSNGVCQPCSNLCSFTEGCTGPSPYECVRCEGPSFVSPNGTLCVSTCNPDSSRKTFYSDSSGVCQPCSSLCSLTEGCTGPSPYECVRCVGHSFVFPNETLCVPTCNPDSSQKTFYASNGVCQPCSNLCSLTEGCTGPSPYECVRCEGPSFVFPNGTLCVSTCNPDSSRKTFYSDSSGVCQPCSSLCSLTEGCTGPSPYKCVRCVGHSFVFPNETLCVPTCNPDSSQKTFYADSNGVCQPCSNLCSLTEGCTGPSPYECVRCEGPSFVFPNGTLCVSTCNPDSSRKTFYSDSSGVCQPCSSLCSLTEGCTGPSPYECVRCVGHSFVFPNETLCVPTCNPDSSQKTFYADSNGVCQPCSNLCSLTEGCTGPSPYECVRCEGPSFVSPNGTLCVSTCNPDSSQKTFYNDSSGVCQPCSSLCSLTGGCTGPTAADCNGCRLLPGSNNTLPTLDGECVTTCPNTNSTYSFNVNHTTNQCELCDTDCIEMPNSRPMNILPAAEAAFIAILVLAVVVIIVVVVVVVLVYKYRIGKYKVDHQTLIEMEEKTKTKEKFNYKQAPTL